MLVDAELPALRRRRDQQVPRGGEAVARGPLERSRRVGLPWQSLGAFLLISTHPRASEHPLSPDEAWSYVDDWLAADAAWIPGPTDHHAEVLGSLVTHYQLPGNLVSDAQLAALAIEHGLTLYPADTDFARFKELRWEDPLAATR